MDVTPLVSKDRQLIESYGDGSFKISGVVYSSPVVVFPELCIPYRILMLLSQKFVFSKQSFKQPICRQFYFLGQVKIPIY